MTRDASSTRSDLLRSARALFSSSPYSHVTTRAIAADAEVDAALIARYFGSKSELFREALLGDDLEPPFHLENAIYGRVEDIPSSLARYVYFSRDDGDPDPLLEFLHSVAEPDAKALLRPMIVDAIVSPLAARLRASGQARDQADRRARLAASIIIGTSITRTVLTLSPSEQEQDAIEADLARALHAALGITER